MNELLENMRSEEKVYSMLTAGSKIPIKRLLSSVRGAKDQGFAFCPQDFAVFRNPKFPETVADFSRMSPDLNRYEKGETIKYMSIFPDIESLNIWFSNKKLIKDMCADENNLFSLFMAESIYNLPIEVRSKMVVTLIEIGDLSKAQLVAKNISESLEKERKEKEYRGESY